MQLTLQQTNGLHIHDQTLALAFTLYILECTGGYTAQDGASGVYLFHCGIHRSLDTGSLDIVSCAALLFVHSQHGLVHQLSPRQLLGLQPE